MVSKVHNRHDHSDKLIKLRVKPRPSRPGKDSARRAAPPG